MFGEIAILMGVVAGVVALGRAVAKQLKDAGSQADDAWGQASRRLKLVYDPGSFTRSRRIEGRYKGQTVLVDTVRRGGGASSATYTRYRVRFPQSLRMGLSISRSGIGTSIGRFLGLPDVRTGDHGFDDHVAVKGDDRRRITALLTPRRRERITATLQQMPEVTIDDDGIEYVVRGEHRKPGRITFTTQQLVGLAQELTGVEEPVSSAAPQPEIAAASEGAQMSDEAAPPDAVTRHVDEVAAVEAPAQPVAAAAASGAAAAPSDTAPAPPGTAPPPPDTAPASSDAAPAPPVVTAAPSPPGAGAPPPSTAPAPPEGAPSTTDHEKPGPNDEPFTPRPAWAASSATELPDLSWTESGPASAPDLAWALPTQQPPPPDMSWSAPAEFEAPDLDWTEPTSGIPEPDLSWALPPKLPHNTRLPYVFSDGQRLSRDWDDDVARELEPSDPADELSVGVVCERLYGSVEATLRAPEVFEAQYEGREIHWEGVLRRVVESAYDFAFGIGHDGRAVFRIRPGEPTLLGSGAVRAVVQLSPETVEDLSGRIGERIPFEGRLVSIDVFGRKIYVANGSVPGQAEGANGIASGADEGEVAEAAEAAEAASAS